MMMMMASSCSSYPSIHSLTYLSLPQQLFSTTKESTMVKELSILVADTSPTVDDGGGGGGSIRTATEQQEDQEDQITSELRTNWNYGHHCDDEINYHHQQQTMMTATTKTNRRACGQHHRNYRDRCHHPLLLWVMDNRNSHSNHFTNSTSTSSPSWSYLNKINMLIIITTIIIIQSSTLLLPNIAVMAAVDPTTTTATTLSDDNLVPTMNIDSGDDSQTISSNSSIILTSPSSLLNQIDINPPRHSNKNSYRQQRQLQNQQQKHLSNVTNPYVFEEHVCGSIDIRNSVAQFKRLENCTIVEGHLKIVLIDNGTPNDFENITFPLLREITDYFLLFRVMGLKSLAKMFPNLSVIRGRALLHNYAFVIYEMLELQEIGLSSLTTIVRGDIRIQKNPNLCFVDTIDWSRIARNFLISDNNDQNVCHNCAENCQIVSARRNDGKSIGDSYNRLCWTPDICQKQSCLSECESLNKTCSSTGECCPEQCLGGCAADPSNVASKICFSCKNFVYQNRCYDVCPNDSYAYYNRRCLTESECHRLSTSKYKFKAFMRECDYKCPVGYTEDPNDERKCLKCGDNCPKICESTQITNIASAQNLKGCTIINGSLTIDTNNQGAQIVKELEENLKDLVEITGFLKIVRSFSLITLNFLKNLRFIRGNTLEREDYSLFILDNPNLQDLWTFQENEFLLFGQKRIQIQKGRIFVHSNPKLCYSRIRNIVNYTDIPMLKWDEQYVSTHSNGDKVPCNVFKLEVEIWDKASELLLVRFENFKPRMEDPRSLLGYLIYYREAEHQNVTKFDGLDVCSSNEWTVIEYDDKDSDKLPNLDQIITNLKPYTQYALYIKTYTIQTATKGAESDIIYFKTLPDTPSQPLNLFAKAKKHDEVWVKWDPPSKPNGEITHYDVRATKDELRIIHRDYCSETGITKDHHQIKPLVIQKEPIINHHWLQNLTDGSKSSNVNISSNNQAKQCCSCNRNDDSSATSTVAATRVGTIIGAGNGGVKLRPNDVEQSINFEDYLIDTVYVKRPVINTNSSEDDLRRKRHIDHHFDNSTRLNNNDDDFYSTTTINNIPNDYDDDSTSTANSGGIGGRTDAPNNNNHTVEDKWQFNKSVFQKLDVLITDLEHYTEYTIEVKACQNQSKFCSVTAITSVKTLPLAGADDIDEESITYEFDNSTSNNQYKNVHIKWKEPTDPNGFILSYQIEYKRVTLETHKSSMAPICITRENYENSDYGYTLQYLAAGNYSIRIRARSLANYGNWTQPFYIIIEEPANSNILFAVIAMTMLLIMIIIPVLYYKFKINQNKLDYMSVNPDYISTGQGYIADPKWEIPREKIKLIRELGEGTFGKVYEGEFTKDKMISRCAVKTLNENSLPKERINFLKEANIMKSFTDCHHVVKLLGICSKSQPFFVLMEIMTRGDLRNYLRNNRPDNPENVDPHPPTFNQICKMAIEIADGMAYLASKRVVHRDLAARNCMLAEDLTVKIGDFGMTRDICESDYYRKGDKGFLPVRWMSPEALQDGIFTTYSDVWAFGVVLWEMVTFASQPYQGLSNEEVLKFVTEGKHMEKPEKCPDVLWQLMVLCWNKKRKARPSFIRIIEILLKFVDEKLFLAVSFYNPSRKDSEEKNSNDANQIVKAITEMDCKEIQDDSLVPLKDPEFHSLNGEEDESDDESDADYSSSMEDIDEQLDDKDMNLRFFPSGILGAPIDSVQQNDNEKLTKNNRTERVATANSYPLGMITTNSIQSKTRPSAVATINSEQQQNGNFLDSETSSDNIKIDIPTTKKVDLPNAKMSTKNLFLNKKSSFSTSANKSDNNNKKNLINGRLIDTSMV